MSPSLVVQADHKGGTSQQRPPAYVNPIAVTDMLFQKAIITVGSAGKYSFTIKQLYYEFMRRNGGLPRAPGDVGACVGFPTARDLNAAIVPRELTGRLLLYGDTNLKKSGSDEDKLVLTVLEMHRYMIHMEETVRRPLNVVQPDNHDLRVQLLTKELTADKMKVTLQMRDKAYRKNLAKSQIYQMAYTVSGDLFRSLIADKKVEEAQKALAALFVYSNGCLDKVAGAYSCKVKHYVVEP